MADYVDLRSTFHNMDYGDSYESTDLLKEWIREKHFGPIIKGKPAVHDEPAATVIKNPNDGQVFANVADSKHQDVEAAVQSSAETQRVWKKMSCYDKAECLLRIGDQIWRHSELISQLMSTTMGLQMKLVRDWDIPLAADVFSYYAGSTILLDAQNTEAGVAAVVIGGACPLFVMAWLITPVLAAGGTVCLKPSHNCSLLALLLVEICSKAGLPEGAINVVPGSRAIGECLIKNSLVKHICFFGKTSIAKQIREDVAGSHKTLKILADSKATMIVYDSADLDSASQEAIRSAWLYQGQVPWAVRTLLIQESVFKEFITKLESGMSALKTGLALSKVADVGPALEKDICDQVARMILRADSRGVQKIQANIAASLPCGNFFPPTFLVGAGVEHNSVLSDSGLAPVVTVLPFRTAKESIALATNSNSGLAASVWTENITLAFDVAKRLEVGTVWLNCHGVFDAAVPFSVRKKSGQGCFGGKQGILPYLTFQSPKVLSEEIKEDCVSDLPTQVTEVKKRTDIESVVGASLSVKNSWEQKLACFRAEMLFKLSKLVRKMHEDCMRDAGHTSDCMKSQLLWCTNRLLYWASVCGRQQLTSSVFIGASNVTSCVQPVGLIAAFLPDADSRLAVDVLASGICFGNRMIISTRCHFLHQLQGLLTAAGVPGGVISVVNGDDVVMPLAQHQAVDSIWFKNGDLKMASILDKAASYGMKPVWAIPPTAPSEIWELNSTVNKTIWVSAGTIFAN